MEKMTHFIIDFELAALKAASQNFPNSAINGCLYYFSQSLWERGNV
jgi:hypothetical protein